MVDKFTISHNEWWQIYQSLTSYRTVSPIFIPSWKVLHQNYIICQWVLHLPMRHYLLMWYQNFAIVKGQFINVLWIRNHLAKLVKWLSCVVSTYLYGAFDCILLSCHICLSEWICTLQLPECQGTSCLKQAWYLKFKWQQQVPNSKPFSL